MSAPRRYRLRIAREGDPPHLQLDYVGMSAEGRACVVPSRYDAYVASLATIEATRRSVTQAWRMPLRELVIEEVP